MTQEPNGTSPPPLRSVLLSGSAWMVGLRWTLRFLGAINIAILARLLTPEDFGVVAMATAVVALSRVFFELGVDYALIRKNDASEAHFNAAWSIRLIQSILLGASIVVVAPFAAQYYGDYRVLPLLWVLAVSVIVQGFANIGVVSFRKELEFGKEFKFLVVAKILSIGFTIVLTFILRSYWALVLGILAANIIESLLSYYFHSFRPKLSFDAVGDIWSFSKWMVLLQFSNYLTVKFDRLLLGGLVPPSRLGHYTMGVELSQMATTELVAPVSRAIVPGLAKLQVDPRRLRAAFLKTIGATALVAMPASIGFALIARELVPIALGPQWIEIVVIVQMVSIQHLFVTLGSSALNISIVTGHISKLFGLSAICAVIFLSLFYPFFSWAGVLGIIYVKTLMAALTTIAFLLVVSKTHNIPTSAMATQVWRPMLSTAIMALCIMLTTPLLNGPLIANLLIKIILGIVAYCAASLILWQLFGEEEDIENDLAELINNKLRRHRSST